MCWVGGGCGQGGVVAKAKAQEDDNLLPRRDAWVHHASDSSVALIGSLVVVEVPRRHRSIK